MSWYFRKSLLLSVWITQVSCRCEPNFKIVSAFSYAFHTNINWLTDCKPTLRYNACFTTFTLTWDVWSTCVCWEHVERISWNKDIGIRVIVGTYSSDCYLLFSGVISISRNISVKCKTIIILINILIKNVFCNRNQIWKII